MGAVCVLRRLCLTAFCWRSACLLGFPECWKVLRFSSVDLLIFYFLFFFFKLSQLWLKHSGLGVNKSVVSFLATTGDVLLSQTQLSDKGHVPKQWAICKACSDKRISVVMSAERDFFFFLKRTRRVEQTWGRGPFRGGTLWVICVQTLHGFANFYIAGETAFLGQFVIQVLLKPQMVNIMWLQLLLVLICFL